MLPTQTLHGDCYQLGGLVKPGLEQRTAELRREAECMIGDIQHIGRAWVLPHPERNSPQIRDIVMGAFGGVLYETPSTEMPMLQKVVCHRSPQSPSPTILQAGTLPQSQQDFQPETMVGKTEDLEIMGRSG
jgi:hypothetical protein